MNTPIESPKLSNEDGSLAQSAGRRRFLGAGTAVITPMILTMVSQPALGVTCFTPSRALSRNTSVSQQAFVGACTGAQSPGNYKQQTSSGTPAYSWPIPASTEFHSKFHNGGTTGTRFVKTVNNQVVSMTMLEVLNAGQGEDPGQVAFHLIGAYLNCLGGGGSNISRNAMTPEGVQVIWYEYATKGYYEPTAGVRWFGTQIKEYLLSNGIVS